MRPNLLALQYRSWLLTNDLLSISSQFRHCWIPSLQVLYFPVGSSFVFHFPSHSDSIRTFQLYAHAETIVQPSAYRVFLPCSNFCNVFCTAFPSSTWEPSSVCPMRSIINCSGLKCSDLGTFLLQWCINWCSCALPLFHNSKFVAFYFTFRCWPFIHLSFFSTYVWWFYNLRIILFLRPLLPVWSLSCSTFCVFIARHLSLDFLSFYYPPSILCPLYIAIYLSICTHSISLTSFQLLRFRHHSSLVHSQTVKQPHEHSTKMIFPPRQLLIHEGHSAMPYAHEQ